MSLQESIKTAAQWLEQSSKICVFTGAGVSRESGIPTFRDPDGLWNKYDPHTFGKMHHLQKLFVSNPRLLASFLGDVAAPIAKAKPNPAHTALATLEARLKARDAAHTTTVITQNVDGLHQDAGNTEVYEIHGSLLKTKQQNQPIPRSILQSFATEMYEIAESPLAHAKLPIALLKMRQYHPNIVLFGDQMNEPDWTYARSAANDCDIMLVVGTAAAVYPAAHLPEIAYENGAKIIAINPQDEHSDGAHIWLKGTAGAILPALVDLLPAQLS